MGPAVHGELLPQQQRSDRRLNGEDHAPAGVSAGEPKPPLCDPEYGLAPVLAAANL